MLGAVSLGEARQRQPRRDGLPEGRQETGLRAPCGHLAPCGCDDGYIACCATCPLPICRYDHPFGLTGLLADLRNARIVALRQSGVAVSDIAERVGISVRSVFRALEKAS